MSDKDKVSINFEVPLTTHTLDADRKRKRMFTDIETQGEALGNMIANQTGSDYPPVKLVLWCYALGEKRPLEMSIDDVAMLKKLIEGSSANAIIKGQLLITIIKAGADADKAELPENV